MTAQAMPGTIHTLISDKPRHWGIEHLTAQDTRMRHLFAASQGAQVDMHETTDRQGTPTTVTRIQFRPFTGTADETLFEVAEIPTAALYAA